MSLVATRSPVLAFSAIKSSAAPGVLGHTCIVKRGLSTPKGIGRFATKVRGISRLFAAFKRVFFAGAGKESASTQIRICSEGEFWLFC